jgi:hypothetical protein
LASSSDIKAYFRLKPCFYFLEAGRFDRRDFAKMMAMPNAVLAVVTQDAAIVAAMDFPIYERQVKPHNLSIGVHPDFPAQFPVSPASRYLVGFIHDLDKPWHRHDELYHVCGLTSPRFTIGELARVCKGISRRTLVRALEDLRGEGRVRCLGRGPDAQWERVG